MDLYDDGVRESPLSHDGIGDTYGCKRPPARCLGVRAHWVRDFDIPRGQTESPGFARGFPAEL